MAQTSALMIVVLVAAVSVVAGLCTKAEDICACDGKETVSGSMHLSCRRAGIFLTIFVLIFCTGRLNISSIRTQRKFAEKADAGTYGMFKGRIYDIRENGDRFSVYVYAGEIALKGIQSGHNREELYDNSHVLYKGRTRLLVYMDDICNLRIGQRISAAGFIARPEVSTNPGAFDARKYYSDKGIYLIAKNVTLTDTGEEFYYIGQLLYKLRTESSHVIDSVFNEEDASVVKAMLLGEKSGIDKDTKRLFQINGIAHILAISGVHIAIIGMILFRLLRRIMGSYVPAGIVSIFVIILYGMMTGMASSTFRAVIMMTIAVAGSIKGRSPDMLTSAGISAVIQSAVDPYIVMDTGFQLSFAAVLGIAVLPPVIMDIFSVKSKIAKTFVVNVSVTIATTPIVIFYYYQFPVWVVFLNMVVVPFVSFILLLSIAIITAGFFSQKMALMGSIPVSCILSFYRKSCEFISNVPGSSINIGHIEVKMIIVFYITIALMLLILRRISALHIRKKLVAYIFMLMVVPAIGIVYEYTHLDRDFKIVFMDVGQGDGILIRSGKGTNILIDGGSSDNSQVGEYVMSPVIKYYGCAHIDYAFATHGDNDHISGIIYLLETPYTGITIDNLVVPAYGVGEELEKLCHIAENSGVNVIYMESGDRILCRNASGGDDYHGAGNDTDIMSVDFLYPGKNTKAEDENDLSAVLMLEYDGVKTLFTGDLGKNGENQLMKSSCCIDADILKAAHHGSRNSSSKEFLDSVSPELAVISAGENNRYGHPHQEALKRLRDRGTSVVCTIEDGAVCVTIKNGGYSIQ